MKKTAYEYMDWPGIEGIIYADEPHPEKVMAPMVVPEGVIYQGFFPGAKDVKLRMADTGKAKKMTLEDEAGYFAVLVPGKKPLPHAFIVDGKERGDAYAYPAALTAEMESRFSAGIAYDVYTFLGAHSEEIEGQTGVRFALWAPNAERASVVGDFNNWDGRCCPMICHEESRIFELFIPLIKEGDSYAFEMRTRNGSVIVRPDPYGYAFSKNDERVFSVVASEKHAFKDSKYMKARAKAKQPSDTPIAVLEANLMTWELPEGTERTYAALAESISDYALATGYTHVELQPVMESPDDTTGGFQTVGYYAPTARYGTPADFAAFMDACHAKGIGVILAWTAGQFSADDRYLAGFDGTCLFEHFDPKQGVHPLWGTKLFNYGSPQVKNFLLANAFYWTKEYHADGLRIDGGSCILRQDYARAPGQWVPNIYGSGENLDGIEFLKHLTSIYRNNFPDGMLVLEEDVDWGEVTGETSETCLGFDYRWNYHFSRDINRFLTLDAAGRSAEHDLLLSGMRHQYMDNFVNSLSRSVGSFDAASFMENVDGSDAASKAALVRCAYAYLFTHPGKKLLVRGEEFDKVFLMSVLSLYRTEPALSRGDSGEKGFSFVNIMDDVLVYTRSAGEEVLVCAFNFSDTPYEEFTIGVEGEGKYKEIFNTDSKDFGGEGFVNARARSSRKAPADERPYSIRVRIAARSACVFRYVPKADK